MFDESRVETDIEYDKRSGLQANNQIPTIICEQDVSDIYKYILWKIIKNTKNISICATKYKKTNKHLHKSCDNKKSTLSITLECYNMFDESFSTSTFFNNLHLSFNLQSGKEFLGFKQ